MTINEIKIILIEKTMKDFKEDLNKEEAAILGYIMSRINSTTINNDGTINYSCFFEHRNNAQWQAEKFLYALYADYNGKKLYTKGA